MRQKIIICGGHFAPAYALIEKLQEMKQYEIHYIGRITALEGDKAESLEYIILKKLSIYFHTISFARLQRSITVHTLTSLFRFPVSLVQSMQLLTTIRPAIVVTFGGYVALPVSIAAWLLHIPIITHEQTHTMGITNSIIARFATIVCLTWKNTRGVPCIVKIEVTGNIFKENISTGSDNKVTEFGDRKLPLLYVTGGSLGSHSINILIAEILAQITEKYRVIHQCGNANESSDFRLLKSHLNKIPEKQKRNYKVIQFLSPGQAESVMDKAYILIGRSGANTVYEVARQSLPALFIPLPWSGGGEQYENAADLEKIGSALVLTQKYATPSALLSSLSYMANNYHQLKKSADKAKKIYSRNGINTLLKFIEKWKKNWDE